MECETEGELREKLSKIDLQNLFQIIKDLDPYTSQNIACSATIDGDFFTGKTPFKYPGSVERKPGLGKLKFKKHVRDLMFRKSQY